LVRGAALSFAGSLFVALGALLDIRMLYLVAAVLLLMGVVKIASIPENKRIIIAHGGDKCPECGTPNELHWYD
jgi:hypothetical protein